MVTRWSTDFLQTKRTIADPLADSTIEAVLLQGERHERIVQDLLNQFLENDSPVPPGLPPHLEAYFRDQNALPEWADAHRMRRGAEVFAIYGPEIVWVLFCRSLPLAYSCAHGAAVLAKTGRLNHPERDDFQTLNRRIMETAQFMMDVLAPDGFGPHGRAIVTIRKVRLIHAAIRHFIRQRQWDIESSGEPINQEDMAGTLMSFSVTVTEGLRLLHVPLSQAQQEDYLHLWNVIGHVLGLDTDLLPENVEDAKALETAILEHQTCPSKEGQELTQANIEYLQHLLRASWLRRFPEVFIRYLVGDEIADALGVQRRYAHWPFHAFMRVARWFAEREQQSQLFRWVFERFNLHLLQGLINEQNPIKKSHFRIPPGLRRDWDLQ